jgi:hypothetical protein
VVPLSVVKKVPLLDGCTGATLLEHEWWKGNGHLREIGDIPSADAFHGFGIYFPKGDFRRNWEDLS